MPVKNKTAAALDVQHKEVVNNLQNYESSIGRQLLSAATAEANQVEEFNDYTAQKQALNRQIGQIEEIVQNLKNAVASAEEQKKQLAELESISGNRLETLGSELYSACRTYVPPEFAEAKDEADTLTESINGYKKKADDIKLELERATIFQRIPLQVKLSSINNSLSLQQKKLKGVLKTGAGKVVAQGRDAIAQMPAPDTLLAAFAAGISVAEEISQKKNELAAASEETVALRTSLVALSVNDSNGKRRIAQIKEEIAGLENAQKKLCQKVGQNYVNLYCTMDGETILQCEGIGETEMPQIIEQRKKLKSISRRYEILQLTSEIEEADRKINQFTSEAEDIAQKIAALQERAKTVDEKIAAANSAKEVLLGKRAMVETEEGTTIKLLREEYGDNRRQASATAAIKEKISEKLASVKPFANSAGAEDAEVAASENAAEQAEDSVAGSCAEDFCNGEENCKKADE